LRPDNSKTEAWPEAEQAMAEVAALDIDNQPLQPASVAIITGAEGLWVSDIEKQGEAYEFNQVQLSYYSALRELGVNIDFISVDSDFAPYSIIIAPSLPIVNQAFIDKCKASSAQFIFGPRAGAKTLEFGYPSTLPPGLLQQLIPIRILSVETLRADCMEGLSWNKQRYQSGSWCEQIDAGESEILARYDNGEPAVVCQDRTTYIGTLTNREFLLDFFQQYCQQANIQTFRFGEDIRVCQRGDLIFAFNYSDQSQELPLDSDTSLMLGSAHIEPHGVTVWRPSGT